jgi:hypothetical protein
MERAAHRNVLEALSVRKPRRSAGSWAAAASLKVRGLSGMLHSHTQSPEPVIGFDGFHSRARYAREDTFSMQPKLPAEEIHLLRQLTERDRQVLGGMARPPAADGLQAFSRFTGPALHHYSGRTRRTSRDRCTNMIYFPYRNDRWDDAGKQHLASRRRRGRLRGCGRNLSRGVPALARCQDHDSAAARRFSRTPGLPIKEIGPIYKPLQRGATSVDDRQLHHGGGRIIGARLPG